jgi:predicted AlkP superfamily phosphohydrolase/phosphomutase
MAVRTFGRDEKGVPGTVPQTGVGAGALAGMILGYEVSAMGDMLPYPKDTVVLVLIFSLAGALTCAAAFLALRIVCKRMIRKRESLARKTSQCQRSAGIFVLLCSQAMFGFVEAFRPVSLRNPVTVLALLGVAAVSAGCSHLLGRWLSRYTTRRSSFAGGRAVWILAYVGVLVMVTGVVSFAVNRTPIRQHPFKSGSRQGRILLLGLDAADWNALSPLIENGKMPNLARLVREGASGNLTSLVSAWGALAGDSITFGIESPAIWTSIVTGKDPWKHGIKDFFLTDIPFVEHPFRHRFIPAFVPYRERIEKMFGLSVRPYTRFFRKSNAAWNIISDAGGKVGALGWWDTWPAENVNGGILSDRFADPNLNKRWSPAGAVSEADLASITDELASYPTKDVAYFTPFPYNPRFRQQYGSDSYEYIRNELLNNFISNYLLDRFKSQLGLEWLRQPEYDFFGVYYYALDVAGHAFTRFKHPEMFGDVEPRDTGYFGGIIDKYCIWFDSELGEYLSRIDDNTTVIICSDHGMGPWAAVQSAHSGVRLSGSHRMQGVVIMWGRNIRRGWKIAHASVLDILPTILYLMGMPVAEDMDGAVIQEALDPAFVGSVPIRTTDTYETKRYDPRLGQGIGSARTGDKNEMEKLKALGYLK